MFVEELDKNFGDVISDPDLSSIKTDGFSLRSGNKILKFSLTEETITPEDEIRDELELKFKEELESIKAEFDNHKDNMKKALDIQVRKLRKEGLELKKQLKNVNRLPNINSHHTTKGLSVANHNDGLKWYFKCVYAPKYINTSVIEPAFAKRLMTPISLEMKTDGNGKVIFIKVMKIIGDEKFKHYHDMGSSDCWGDSFKPSTNIINTPDEAIDLFKKALVILETINEFSLANRTPKGLSRFNTLKNHLVEGKEKPTPKKSTVTSRNARTGFDESVNEDLSDNIWTV